MGRWRWTGRALILGSGACCFARRPSHSWGVISVMVWPRAVGAGAGVSQCVGGVVGPAMECAEGGEGEGGGGEPGGRRVRSWCVGPIEDLRAPLRVDGRGPRSSPPTATAPDPGQRSAGADPRDALHRRSVGMSRPVTSGNGVPTRSATGRTPPAGPRHGEPVRYRHAMPSNARR